MQQWNRSTKGSEMLSWLRRRRETAGRREAKANALVRAFGGEAYAQARQRERGAGNGATAREWSRVALAVASKTGGRVGLDTSTPMASEGRRFSRVPCFANSLRAFPAWLACRHHAPLPGSP